MRAVRVHIDQLERGGERMVGGSCNTLHRGHQLAIRKRVINLRVVATKEQVLRSPSLWWAVSVARTEPTHTTQRTGLKESTKCVRPGTKSSAEAHATRVAIAKVTASFETILDMKRSLKLCVCVIEVTTNK